MNAFPEATTTKHHAALIAVHAHSSCKRLLTACRTAFAVESAVSVFLASSLVWVYVSNDATTRQHEKIVKQYHTLMRLRLRSKTRRYFSPTGSCRWWREPAVAKLQ